jgi:hypothetical protein
MTVYAPNIQSPSTVARPRTSGQLGNALPR